MAELEQDRLTQLLRDRLIVLRDKHGWNDSSWARAANLRQQDVSRFTRGRMTYPTLEWLNTLCSVFPEAPSLGHVLVNNFRFIKRARTVTMEVTQEQVDMLLALDAMEPDLRAAFYKLVAPRQTKTRRRR
jgi:uncharacterized LabA/DUF88 family protein